MCRATLDYRKHISILSLLCLPDFALCIGVSAASAAGRVETLVW
jgi:hypothetical protein